MKPHERVFVALDTPDLGRATRLAAALAGQVGGFKVGLELFSSHGPDAVRAVQGQGLSVFLDLKLHDIPNTVAGAAAAAGRLGAAFLTVHALGGPEMIRRAVVSSADAARASGNPPPGVLAVTILTSLADADLVRLGISGPCGDAVPRLAAIAREAGATGVVCSPLEIASVRSAFPEGVIVVPGIRLASTAGPRHDDQARVATPGRAVEAGADRIVVGRPISEADDPAAAAAAVVRDIAETVAR